MRGDSTNIPHCNNQHTSALSLGERTSPPPKNMMLIETCSRSWAVQSLPQAAKCSRKTLLTPYSQITNDSVNSALGREAFQDPTSASLGLTFHAQPRSAKQPDHRPRVKIPYQKKMPPLMKWARPLKMLLPR